MYKYYSAFFMIVFAFFPFTVFAENHLIIPAAIEIEASNPAKAFAANIQHLFEISASTPTRACLEPQQYTLRTFIYRNAVDNKFIAHYRPAHGNPPCSVTIITNAPTHHPDFGPGGWEAPVNGANTWCKVAGLRDPSLCPIIIK